MSVLRLQAAEVFAPLFGPSRYKGVWGGRGSGKSHFFAERLILKCVEQKTEWVCIREVQKTLAQSAKKLLESKIEALSVGSMFEVQNDRIKCPNGGLIIFQGMQDHTADSIKSLEGFDGAWVEEAQSLSERSLTLLRPTIRKPGSELWFSWNPSRKTDPVDKLLRGDELPTDAIVLRANWSDNPWFPDVLEQERLDCQRTQPEQYGHIWEGDYAGVYSGAYYAKHLLEARTEGRITRVGKDPLMRIRAFFDIGGTGARADAVAIWIAQFIGREIRVLNYYEAQGQPLATHVMWLKKNGYGPDACDIVLPHDGDTNDKVFDVSYKSSLEAAGYDVTVVPNQGKGAAAARIESARRLFSLMWFNETTTEGGRAALGWYHEKKDEVRDIGLGPEHDWSSHAADAFGLLCVAYEKPTSRPKNINMPSYGAV